MENTTQTQLTYRNGKVHPFEAAGLGTAPFRFVRFEKSVFRATPDAPAQCGTSCDYCATGIMNVFWCRSAEGREFKVGCDCVFKTCWKDDTLRQEVRKAQRDVQRATQTAKREARRAEIRAARVAEAPKRAQRFMDLNPGLEQALQLDNDVVRDIAGKLQEWGDLSPRQIEYVWALYAKAYGPQLPPEVNVPAPTGRVTVCGVVVSTRTTEGMYGIQHKMVVKVTNAKREVWLVWTTIPSNLYGYNVAEYGVRHSDELKGCSVKFDATLEPGRDAHFAFGKRPTKASITHNPNL